MKIQAKTKQLRNNKGLAQKQLADALHVSTDYLLSDTDDEEGEIKIQDQAFVDKIRLLDSLDDKEKETVINVIDAMLTKKKMLNLLTEKHEHA
ncbi:MAG: hypothetical protein SVW57_11445 [Thermodesulfobacteriota bacterium]|nr:hypothetical protein [Thermodesulfobacteriota bacterium]